LSNDQIELILEAIDMLETDYSEYGHSEQPELDKIKKKLFKKLRGE